MKTNRVFTLGKVAAKYLAGFVMMIQFLVISNLAWAQEKATDINVDMNTDGGGGGGAWYGNWWVWAILVAVFIVVIVAITNRPAAKRD